METMYFVRSYPHYKKLLEKLESEQDNVSKSGGELRRGTQISDPTANIAILIADLKRNINIIEMALEKIPEKYRDNVLIHVLGESHWNDARYDSANIKTWQKWQQIFLYYVAVFRGEGFYVEYLSELEGMK